MSSAQPLTGSIAASTVLRWLRAWHADGMPDAVDLEVVRQMLPETPYGKGVREIKAPMVLDCWRRSKFDPPCRLNFDPGLGAGIG